MAGSAANPYAVSKEPSSTGAAPDPSGKYRWGGPGAYSVPDIPNTTDPEWTDGYSPQIAAAGSPTGAMLPDDVRTGRRKEPENDPNNLAYNRLRSAEWLNRVSVEHVTLGNYPAMQDKPNVPVVPDQVQAKLPIRPTATQAPVDNLVSRPWPIPGNAAETAPGVELHVSMADHRRDYPIYLMQPRGGIGVNHIHQTPTPWDTNLFVAPETPANAPEQGIFGGRKWGL